MTRIGLKIRLTMTLYESFQDASILFSNEFNADVVNHKRNQYYDIVETINNINLVGHISTVSSKIQRDKKNLNLSINIICSFLENSLNFSRLFKIVL